MVPKRCNGFRLVRSLGSFRAFTAQEIHVRNTFLHFSCLTDMSDLLGWFGTGILDFGVGGASLTVPGCGFPDIVMYRLRLAFWLRAQLVHITIRHALTPLGTLDLLWRCTYKPILILVHPEA